MIAGELVVLPLLATQVLWVNLVSDGAPALALGVDPADEGVMRRRPRPRSEGVITRRMWAGSFFVGVVMAAGTLRVFDWSLPGGLVEGSGDMRYAQTMAFTTVVFFSLHRLQCALGRAERFRGAVLEQVGVGAVLLSLLMQAAVIYVPFLQQAFSTVSLSAADWLRCAGVAKLRALATRAEQAGHARDRPRIVSLPHLTFHTAERMLEGAESMHMLRKGQVKRPDGRDSVGQAKFVASLFGVAA